MIETLRDGRYVIGGLVYTISVIEVIRSHDPSLVGNRDLAMACTRCGVRWSTQITRDELQQMYQRIPSRSSPLTILERVHRAKRELFGSAAGHVCMPPGYAAIPTNVLERLDRSATKAEQYDALATVLAELAIAEGV